MEHIMQRGEAIYRGKAKTLYRTDDPNYLLVEFRNDATAFDGVKHAELANKGAVNNQFNAYIMEYFAKAGIPTHFIKAHSTTESIIKNLKMIPVECVIRNIAAGSLSKRLGLEEGSPLNSPIFEFFLKNDELHDPMINQYHILSFNWATQKEIERMTELTFKVNEILKPLFAKHDMLLVDYKLEFGRFGDEVILGDEFTPDGCRIWDSHSQEKLDKDRFRRDLGQVIESYQEVARRLGIPIILNSSKNHF